MDLKKDLIGLRYPVKDETGKVVGYKTIRKVHNLSSLAVFAINVSSDPEATLIPISFTEAMELKESQTDLNLEGGHNDQK